MDQKEEVEWNEKEEVEWNDERRTNERTNERRNFWVERAVELTFTRTFGSKEL